ncbi:alpha/beta hydrolase [Kribbella sp. NPDC056861]|uniref:alpha/beta hydrolase n=1 Tax=Kribbella sp. NPDC056861 TaxID=3154857 RepID=UPI0034265084
MRRGQVAGFGLVLVAVGGMLTPAAANSAAGEVGPKVAWGNCPADVTAKYPATVPQCAKVPVPLDYARPGGATIDIMISRLASTGSARRGILMTNPGGPGGAGLSMPAELMSFGLPAGVAERYDLIGMDPRGVGHSSPVSCGFTEDQAYTKTGNVPPYAVDAADVAAQAKIAKAVADQCAAHDDKKLLQHISTADAARDMDTIRAALGEEKLNYFGGSYGTSLGATYASLFPQRTDRVILDSVSGGPVLDRASQRRFGIGFELRFPDLAEFIAARHTAYGLGRTVAEVRRNFVAFAGRLDKAPVETITGVEFRGFVFGSLYSDAQFPQAAQFWQSLAIGDAAGVRRALAVAAAGNSQYDNFFSAYLAVTCNDSVWPRDLATYQRDVAADRKAYPLYGAAGANIMPCAFWHNQPRELPAKITDQGPKNVLLLQNLRDPATPHVGAVQLRKAFGDRSRLVSVDAGGHGAYVYSTNACVTNVATAYLVDGVLPRKDVFCKAS